MKELWKIYVVTNLVNGKKYVGRTRYDNDNYYGSGDLVKKAVRKYGKKNFSKVYVDSTLGSNEANKLEVEWILKEDSLIPNGYNLLLHGYGGNMSESQKDIIKKSVKSQWDDPNSIFNSEEYRKRLSDAARNRTWSDETKEKIRQSKLGSNNPNAKRYQVGDIIFETQKECAETYNISGTAVRKRCKSKNFPDWKFVD